MSVFDTFVKKHDFLVCVDSDGCAMDTMNCKHFHCFGPCMVDEWALDEWRELILKRWNEINLFQMTRGINRFKGLAMALSEISAKYTPIVGVEALKAWADTAPALSN
ncbi:MAG: HAD family hydrolase, partial [Oscillospiraceae bacterium]|nr:HAD family hydrolase [Oscillospiraceae bacterium]